MSAADVKRMKLQLADMEKKLAEKQKKLARELDALVTEQRRCTRPSASNARELLRPVRALYAELLATGPVVSDDDVIGENCDIDVILEHIAELVTHIEF